MKNKTMTAVEWLQDKLNNVKPTQLCSLNTIKEWVEQAKEKEEQNIINAFDAGHRSGAWNFLGEEYYEETYKNENNV